MFMAFSIVVVVVVVVGTGGAGGGTRNAKHGNERGGRVRKWRVREKNVVSDILLHKKF